MARPSNILLYFGLLTLIITIIEFAIDVKVKTYGITQEGGRGELMHGAWWAAMSIGFAATFTAFSQVVSPGRSTMLVSSIPLSVSAFAIGIAGSVLDGHASNSINKLKACSSSTPTSAAVSINGILSAQVYGSTDAYIAALSCAHSHNTQSTQCSCTSTTMSIPSQGFYEGAKCSFYNGVPRNGDCNQILVSYRELLQAGFALDVLATLCIGILALIAIFESFISETGYLSGRADEAGLEMSGGQKSEEPRLERTLNTLNQTPEEVYTHLQLADIESNRRQQNSQALVTREGQNGAVTLHEQRI